jgi:hypothetical protein
VCEQILEERDGVLSATRIVDRFVLPRSDASDEVPGVEVRYLAMLRRGEAAILSGNHEASVVLRYPSGRREVITTDPWSVSWPAGDGEDEGVNLSVRLTLALPEEGLYWLDLLFDRTPVASTPMRVIFTADA